MVNHDPNIRAAALRLLKSGRATIPEIMNVAGLSRQILRHWAIAAGIDTSEQAQMQRRVGNLKKIWLQEIKKV